MSKATEWRTAGLTDGRTKEGKRDKRWWVKFICLFCSGALKEEKERIYSRYCCQNCLFGLIEIKRKTQNLLHNNFQKIIIQVMTRRYWTIVINFIYKKFIKHINDTYLTNRSHYFVFPEHKHTAFLHRQLFYSLSMYYGIVLSN